MDIKEAKYRVKAKKFRDSIGGNYCKNLPDDLIDSTPDEDIKLLKRCLYAVGLVQIKSMQNYGYWERAYNPDPDHHFKLEEIL